MPRRLFAACCLVVASVVIVACGTTLDPDGLETQIGEQLADRFPESVWTVACPEDVEPQAGDTFRCTATGDDERSLDIEVTQDDSEGSVIWHIVG